MEKLQARAFKWTWCLVIISIILQKHTSTWRIQYLVHYILFIHRHNKIYKLLKWFLKYFVVAQSLWALPWLPLQGLSSDFVHSITFICVKSKDFIPCKQKGWKECRLGKLHMISFKSLSLRRQPMRWEPLTTGWPS